MEFPVVLKATVNNPDVGDMQLSDNGDLVMVTDLSTEVAQRLQVAFNFFKGEWFLDLDEGTPWFQYILVKAPQDRVIRTVFTQLIANTEGVASVSKFAYSISKDRKISLSFECVLKDASTFSTANYTPFVLSV